MKKILVASGTGFIGQRIAETEVVTKVNGLTCAGSLDSLLGLIGHQSCIFEQIDICPAREAAREGEISLSAKDACSAALANGEVFA